MSADNFTYGIRAVIESIRSGKEIDKLLIQKDLKGDLIRELLSLAAQMRLPVARVPVEKLNRITRKNHQGAIAFISEVAFASIDHVIQSCYEQGRDPLLIVLDGITDVRNFGAIARTAECAGVDALVIPGKGGAQVNADAVKTSAGALHHIPLCREMDLSKAVAYLKNNGLTIVAATEKSEKNIYQNSLEGPLAIIVGSEERGISPQLLKMADEWAAIPLYGSIGSLNVSVAAAVFIYEAVRQRKNSFSKPI